MSANEAATKFWDETLKGGSYSSITLDEALSKQSAGALVVDARPAGDTAVSTMKGAVPMEEYEKKVEAGELKDTEVVFFCWIGGGSGKACNDADPKKGAGGVKDIHLMKYGLAGVAKEHPELIVDSNGASTKTISAVGVEVVKDFYDGFDVKL